MEATEETVLTLAVAAEVGELALAATEAMAHRVPEMIQVEAVVAETPVALM
jgi:hypothetical protein